MSEKNVVNWVGRNGKEISVALEDMQEIYEEATCLTTKTFRKADLQYLFKTTYHAAIQGGVDIVDAIAKAMKAVALAGKYDEAMKQAVEARLNAEFPE